MRTHIKPAAKRLVNRWLVIQDLERQRQTHWSSSPGYLFVPYHRERPSKVGDAWGWHLKLSLASAQRLTDVPWCPRGGISMFPHPSFTDVCSAIGIDTWTIRTGQSFWSYQSPSLRDSSVQHARLLGYMMYNQKQSKDNSVSKETERRCFHLASI